MEFEGYMDTASDEFKALQAKLQPNLDRDLELFRNDIKAMIASEIMQRKKKKKGVLIHELQTDKALEKAIEILKDKALYKKTLEAGEKTLKTK